MNPLKKKKVTLPSRWLWCCGVWGPAAACPGGGPLVLQGENSLKGAVHQYNNYLFCIILIMFNIINNDRHYLLLSWWLSEHCWSRSCPHCWWRTCEGCRSWPDANPPKWAESVQDLRLQSSLQYPRMLCNREAKIRSDINSCQIILRLLGTFSCAYPACSWGQSCRL